MKGIAWMTYSYVVGFSIQGVYFVLLARVLAPEQFGQWAGAQATAVFASTFATLGSGNLLVIGVARDRSQFRPLMGRALGLLGISAPVLIGVTAAIGLAISPTFALITIFLGVAEILGNKAVELSAQAAQSQREIHIAAHLNVLIALARLLVLLGSVVAGGELTVLKWSAIYAITSVIAGALMLTFALRRYGWPMNPRGLFKPASTGTYFSLGMASRIIYNDADKYLLNLFGLITTAGLYATSYRITNLAFAPLQAVVYASNVELFRRGESGIKALWPYVRRLAILQIAGSMIIVVAG